MEAAYRAPMTLDCPRYCVVPPGTTWYPIPLTDADKEDVKVCPHNDCGQAFLVNHDDSDK